MRQGFKYLVSDLGIACGQKVVYQGKYLSEYPFLAGDGFTADILGIPRSAEYVLSATIHEIQTRPYEYMDEQGNYKKAMGDVETGRWYSTGWQAVSSADIQRVGDIALTVEGQATIDQNMSRLFAQGPGDIRIKASTQFGFGGIDPKLHPRKAKEVNLEAVSQTIRGVVFKKIGIEGIDLPGDSPRTDYFDHPSMNRTFNLVPGILLNDGHADILTQVRQNKLEIEATGDTFGLRHTYYTASAGNYDSANHLNARYRGGIGKTDFKLLLRSEGEKAESQTYTLSANRTHIVLDPPPSLPNGVRVGQAYKARMVVDGPAPDMSAYEVTWSMRYLTRGRPKGEALPGQIASPTNFTKAEGAWVAETTFRIDPAVAKGWGEGSFEDAFRLFTDILPPLLVLEGTLAPKGQGGVFITYESYGKHVGKYTQVYEPAPALYPPALSSLQLFVKIRRPPGSELPELVELPTETDIFVVSGGKLPDPLEFDANLQFADGKNFDHVPWKQLPWLKIESDEGPKFLQKDSGLVLETGTIENTGIVELFPSASARDAVNLGRITFADDEERFNSDLRLQGLYLTVNRLMLTYAQTGKRRIKLAVTVTSKSAQTRT